MARLRQPPFALLLALAWLLLAAGLLVQSWPRTGDTLLDTDDAMRLVEMRDWLAGQGWFDLRQARIQPFAYEAHWSRLIDLGLAGLFALFHLFTDTSFAERLMRAVWPLLWLLPTMTGMVAIAWRLAGREAALAALVLALAGIPAYQQFMPGRIDHHNVQIALAMLVVAATVWSDRVRWCGSAAGVLTGFALAIGLESVPYLAACAAALALRFALDRGASAALRDYAAALSASAFVAFLLTVGPQHWMRSQCDAIGINIVGAVVAGGLVLAVAGWVDDERAAVRSGLVAASGAAALIVFAACEPRCLAGPFAMVDPGIWPIWHSDVRELQPLIRVFQVNPLTATAIATFPAAALTATGVLAMRADLRRDFAFLTMAAVLLLAALTTVAAIRAFSYAMWFGMPLVATAALSLFAALRLQTLLGRLVATLMLTPMALSGATITLANAAGLDDKDSFLRLESRACFKSANYAPLAQLPPGIVVTDISYGPFLLALTPHAVASAPYHRLSAGIIPAYRALVSLPVESRGVLRDLHASYVIVCGPRPPDGLAEPARSASLWGRLQANDVPRWLEPVPDMGPFKVYRVKS
jgi:hypothetical protein